MTHADWRLSRSRLGGSLRVLVLVGALLATLRVAPQSFWHWLLLGACWSLFIVDRLVARHRVVEGLSVRAGRWFLWRAEERLPARLLRYHAFGNRFVVLTFGVGASAVWRVNVFPDMMTPADFRRLRLALRVLREPNR